MEIIGVAALDAHRRDLADAERPAACHIHRPVDFRGVTRAASLGNGRPHLIDDDLPARTDFSFETPLGDGLLAFHEKSVRAGRSSSIRWGRPLPRDAARVTPLKSTGR